MIPKIIRNEIQYKAVMKRIEELFHAIPGTDEDGELGALILVAEEYEDRTVHIEPPDPITMIKFCMSQNNLEPEDVVDCFDTLNNVHEFLNGQLDLTVPMIRKLMKRFTLTADLLIQEPKQSPVLAEHS